MTQDHNKKSVRQFQCRDYLWEIFEQMGSELECSTDYLVNEAMRQYARSRNWGARGRQSAPGGMPAPMTALGSAAAPGRPGGPTRGSQPGAQPVSPAQAAPLAQTGPLATARAGGNPASRPMSQTGAGLRPAGAQIPGRPASTATGSMPPPLPGAPMPAASGTGSVRMPSLFVIFNGQKVPVNKEEFVIGRGSKTADLPIKDGNISRRHAAVVLQNGAFYMKDLGSTNGVEFNGERVDVRRIEEGDVYQMCDYELRFTFR